MKSILLFAVIGLFLGCGGTGTGNPGIRPGDNHSGAALSDLVLTPICELLKSCHQTFDVSDCHKSVAEQKGFGPRLGLQNSEGLKLTEILGKIVAGLLAVEAQSHLICLTDLKVQSCQSSAVQNAYQPREANPYELVAEILPVSCSAVLKEKN